MSDTIIGVFLGGIIGAVLTLLLLPGIGGCSSLFMFDHCKPAHVPVGWFLEGQE